MKITNFRSSKEVINQVYADNGYDIALNFADMVSWIYECMELIGSPMQYIPKIAGVINHPPLEITDYKAKLPCDFHKLRGILVNGRSARLSSSEFHHLLSGECCDMDTDTSSLLSDYLDNFGNEFSTGLGNQSTVQDVITFDINNNYLTLSVQEGTVCMSYWAFPLDENGYPLIPDVAKYRLALAKYLTKKIDWILYRKGDINRDIYEKSENDCNWYMGSISTALKVPDQIEMEVFKNMAVRLRPVVNNELNQFGTLGTPERRPIN